MEYDFFSLLLPNGSGESRKAYISCRKNFIKCNDLIVALIIGHNTQQVVKERLIEECHANNIETYYTYLNENDLDIMIVPTDFKYVYDGSPIEKQLENFYQKNNSILNYEGKLIEPVDINND